MLTSEPPVAVTLTTPEVPRTPVTIVEVRMFSVSLEESGADTLKNSSPEDTSSSSLEPLLRTSTFVEASSFTTLVLSRLT